MLSFKTLNDLLNQQKVEVRSKLNEILNINLRPEFAEFNAQFKQVEDESREIGNNCVDRLNQIVDQNFEDLYQLVVADLKGLKEDFNPLIKKLADEIAYQKLESPVDSVFEQDAATESLVKELNSLSESEFIARLDDPQLIGNCPDKEKIVLNFAINKFLNSPEVMTKISEKLRSKINSDNPAPDLSSREKKSFRVELPEDEVAATGPLEAMEDLDPELQEEIRLEIEAVQEDLEIEEAMEKLGDREVDGTNDPEPKEEDNGDAPEEEDDGDAGYDDDDEEDEGRRA